jgi:hypothetical protein
MARSGLKNAARMARSISLRANPIASIWATADSAAEPIANAEGSPKAGSWLAVCAAPVVAGEGVAGAAGAVEAAGAGAGGAAGVDAGILAAGVAGAGEAAADEPPALGCWWPSR